tara:strand:- start:280 stop:684 length:405 start_codon:yes stop_codon:yes gene_type:complete
MSNYVYDKAAGALWGADIAFDTDNIKAYLIDTALYTADKVNDEFLTDVPAGARTAVSANLGTKTITGRIIDAANVVFTAVPTGAANEAVILVQDTAVEATSRVIIYADTATGLPVTPNDTDITVIWNVSGIATL